jgi:eukaryotic-like serine/threonine-protein kinase
MTVSGPVRCPHCGTVRVAQTAPLDLCPACLLTTALSMDDEPCPYQVLAPIGEGSTGVTYLAQALSGARGYIALKVLGPRDDVDAVLSRYQRWKPALARVQHPGVSKLLDIGLTAEGLLYAASEYVAGWPLTGLGSRASIGMDERVGIARQLTDAIEAVHAAGVMHLKLDSSRVKISTVGGPHTTILGLGSALIVDGASGGPDLDRLALAGLIRELGVKP